MSLHNTTPTPNEFFSYIPLLTHAELRVILVVIRQTYGWKDKKTGQRKIKDKLSYEFIIKRTGLYRTVLTSTIQSLIDLGILIVSDKKGNILLKAEERKGKRSLFYQFQPIRNFEDTCSQIRIIPIRNSEHNKRNTYQKKLLQKENIKKITEINHSLSEHVKIKFE